MSDTSTADRDDVITDGSCAVNFVREIANELKMSDLKFEDLHLTGSYIEVALEHSSGACYDYITSSKKRDISKLIDACKDEKIQQYKDNKLACTFPVHKLHDYPGKLQAKDCTFDLISDDGTKTTLPILDMRSDQVQDALNQNQDIRLVPTSHVVESNLSRCNCAIQWNHEELSTLCTGMSIVKGSVESEPVCSIPINRLQVSNPSEFHKCNFDIN